VVPVDIDLPAVMNRSTQYLVLASLTLAAACGDDAPTQPGSSSSARKSGPIWFEEVSAAAGVDFQHVRAHEHRAWIPETITGGAAWLDYDGDGHLDLYCVQGGDPVPGFEQLETNRLFKNNGDGSFTDVTLSAGVAGHGYGFGCATADYDGDGHTDLYVCNLEENLLFRNNGDGTFAEVGAQAGVDQKKWGAASSFLDYDADGDMDLMVVNYLNWTPEREIECQTSYGERDYCNPINYNAPSQDTLYRNNGDGTFSDVTKESGIGAGTGTGLGCVAADYDGDGDVDIYVTNDGMPNYLWMNDGRGGFREEGILSGCAVNMNGSSEAGMGVQAVDVENDGDWDLFMTHVREQTNTFYLNDSKGVFTDRTIATGLAQASRQFTGFGLGFHDFNHDGEIDLFVANGRVGLWRPAFSETDPFAEPNQVFQGRAGGKFSEIKGWKASEEIGTSRAAAFADYDADGDIDVYVANAQGPGRLYRNCSEKSGEWIGFDVRNTDGSVATGARVKVVCGGKVQYRLAHSGYSFAAANDDRVHFGLAAGSKIETVEVLWPGGESESFTVTETGAYKVLSRGQGN
jgi:hypothetical protein